MVDDHYVTREEFEALVAAARPKKGGLIQFVCGTLMVALAVIGGYFLLVIYFDAPPAPASAPAPIATPSRALPTPGMSGGGGITGTLPDCATVTDSRTACTGAVGEMPQGQQEGPQAEQAPPTPTPPYLAECLTPPGERPCWLPADAAWQPPASVPETPIVLLPEPPIVDVCAMWHAPLPWPEGCGNE